MFSLWVNSNKKTHVALAVTEKFTFMTSMLKAVVQFQLIS